MDVIEYLNIFKIINYLWDELIKNYDDLSYILGNKLIYNDVKHYGI